jgi:8-oxo-dGTP pyrophosphatase MutT (NUDIX family)
MILINTFSLDTVRRALTKPLLGLLAQQAMMPPYRQNLVPREIVNPKHGGVLILLYPKNGEWYFVLTRRTDHLETHKGQISLPGGGHEPHDVDYQATALREAREELNIELNHYEVLGQLSTIYVPPSNFYVYPTVAYIDHRPDFHPDPFEVAEVIEVSLTKMLDPQTRVVEEWTMPQYNGLKVMMPHYRVGAQNEHKVWGATAIMLAEFVAMIQAELSGGG